MGYYEKSELDRPGPARVGEEVTMETIRIAGKAGLIQFAPSHISQSKIERIERALRKLVAARQENYISASEIRTILKKKDPLIGTSGGTIHAYRSRAGLTQHKLAKRAGLKQSHLSEMESNRRPVGRIVAKKLAKALNCDHRRFL